MSDIGVLRIITSMNLILMALSLFDFVIASQADSRGFKSEFFGFMC